MHSINYAGASYAWNSVVAKANTGGFGRIVTDNDPRPTVANGRWVKRIGITDGQGHVNPKYAAPANDPNPGYYVLAGDIYNALVAGASVVMLDELNSYTQDLVTWTAVYLGDASLHGAYTNLWGAYIANGPLVDYSTLATPLYYLFRANARVAPEFYVYYDQNFAAGAESSLAYNYVETGGDPWLIEFFNGGTSNTFPEIRPAANRLTWLMQWRGGILDAFGLPTVSIVTPIFGVIDWYLDKLDGTARVKMLDRMFYCFARTPYPSLMHTSNDGGAGSWIWDSGRISSTYDVRDDQFCQSFAWYCELPYQSGSRNNWTVPIP